MTWIKTHIKVIATRTATVAAVLLLCACAGQAAKDDPTSAPSLEPDNRADQTPLALIPNPYLLQKVRGDATAQAQFANAQTAMKKQDWGTAVNILLQLNQQYPKLSGPYVNLGITYWRQDKLELAEQNFIQAIKVNRFNNDAYNQLGILLREQGRFTDALEWYQKALKVWPHAPHTLRNLGILYELYLGRLDDALRSYELALKVLPQPSRELQGWIIDLKRRMNEGGK